MATLITRRSLNLARRPMTHVAAPQRGDWKRQAIASDEAANTPAVLRYRIATRLRELLGVEIAPEQIWISDDARMGATIVDGILFRWEQGDLRIIRPCALCGVGEIASKPLETMADVGEALRAREACHPACEPDDAADALDYL